MNKPEKYAVTAIISISLLAGVLISTAGVALFPQLANASARAVCGNWTYYIEKTDFKYKPGQSGYFLRFYPDDKRKPDEEINPFLVMAANSIIYSILFLITGFLMRPIYFGKFVKYVERVLRNNNRL